MRNTLPKFGPFLLDTLYTFPKRKIFSKMFQKFFGGPFPGAPGAHAHHFRIPILLLHNISKNIFLFKKVLQKFFGPFPRPPRLTSIIFEFPFSCYIPSQKQKNIFSNNFEKNFLGPFPGVPGAHAHHFRIPLLLLYTLPKIIFFKNFLGPFPGPSGLIAHHFRFPLRLLHTL